MRELNLVAATLGPPRQPSELAFWRQSSREGSREGAEGEASRPETPAPMHHGPRLCILHNQPRIEITKNSRMKGAFTIL
jgi:hypothetical protein